MSDGPRPLRSAAAIRRRVLAEWRRYSEPPDPVRHLRRAGDVARDVLTAMGVAAQMDEESVRAGWAGAVGSFLAAHSSPLSLRGGILTVRVVQPSVRYTLEQGMKRDLLARLQQMFGQQVIRDLAFTTA